MRLAVIPPLLSILLLAPPATGAAADGPAQAAAGEITVYGTLREMMHQGRTDARVTLDALLPDPALVAVGALADLAGEITVVGGTAYLSYPDGDSKVRTEVSTAPVAGAALLVASQVPAWTNVRTEEPILFEDLDDAVARLAARAGVGNRKRFPFMMTGDLEDLRWHVVDSRRLPEGPSTHEDHQAASVRAAVKNGPATLIGFYSGHDQGIFTHMNSKTHVHCVVDEPLSSGHVDHVVIPAGTIVSFPAPRRD